MPSSPSHTTGCRFCGQPLKTLDKAISARCMICGKRGLTHTWCTAGHFVCESCRSDELIGLLERCLEGAAFTDPVEMFLTLRQGEEFPMHGPEHHALVVASLLVPYHRLYGEPEWPLIIDAVREAASALPGGSCGRWGACSGALAVGIAFATILQSTPMEAAPRATAHKVVAAALATIGDCEAPRCCRRDCLLALHVACELSEKVLPHPLKTSFTNHCEQAEANEDCMGDGCPYI
ncbi:MAG: DUF5714 domain-containing protein [Armatimonadota bacterium]